MLASARHRLVLGVGLIAFAGLAVWYGNQIAPNIRDLSVGWNWPYLFPLMTPVGADFRNGVYFPGTLLVNGMDPHDAPTFWYPPFSALFLLPYQAVDPDWAYLIHAFVLIFLNIASVWCAIRLTESTIPRRVPPKGPVIPGRRSPCSCPFAVRSLQAATDSSSASERGNFDLYALAFSLAGLWILVRCPRRLWLQVVCFSAAAHLKVYPAVLFLLLFWRHGRRSLVPIVVDERGPLVLHRSGSRTAFHTDAVSGDGSPSRLGRQSFCSVLRPDGERLSWRAGSAGDIECGVPGRARG